MSTAVAEKLAINGGEKTFDEPEAFAAATKWPIVIKEDEDAVIQVMRNGNMSGTDITKQFEKEYAEFNETKYALGVCNGTAALEAAFWACGVGMGDEIICPSMTYWASCTSALSLCASVNFADIEKDSLCIDPDDIEHRICDRTKAIVVVHYTGHPADMDRIMAIAKKHNVKVIEDVSHAQGSLYKGKIVGSIGDIGCASLMAGKSFAVGEAGMITTNDNTLYQRCVAYGHYERMGGASMYNPAEQNLTDPALTPFIGAPMGGKKHRMNQTCSAMGRVQLKYYPERIKEIQSAMNRFWDLLDGVPGLKAHRPDDDNSTMGGWYAAKGLYRAEELGGLPCAKFCEALTAQGVWTSPGANGNLHLHPVFQDMDLYNTGKPSMIAFAERDVRQGPGTLPVGESIKEIAYSIPWIKKDNVDLVTKLADTFRRVAENADQIEFEK